MADYYVFYRQCGETWPDFEPWRDGPYRTPLTAHERAIELFTRPDVYSAWVMRQTAEGEFVEDRREWSMYDEAKCRPKATPGQPRISAGTLVASAAIVAGLGVSLYKGFTAA